MKHNSIPILFGITGHRDLRPEDIHSLKKSVHNILQSYKDKYPNTEIFLISALAEGADMLAAEVARDLSITLKVVIPYTENEYLKSFVDNKAKKKYRELVEYADGDPTLTPDIDSRVNDKEAHYQKLGEYIANTSTILIALYDGIDTGKQGGTSAVVNYARKGFKDNLFDPLDGDAVFLINTPRQSNPDIDNPFQESREFLGMMNESKFYKMLEKLDETNNTMRAELIAKKDGSLLKELQYIFDEKANRSQSIYKKYLIAILTLTGLGIFFLELMHNLSGITPWSGHLIIGYATGIGLAFLLFRILMKNGKLQDDFVFSRAFGEAIRIQIAWNSEEIQEPVSKYYLANQSNKFTWIRVALKNLYFLDKKSCKSNKSWIDGQIEYFETYLPKRKDHYERIEKLEKGLLYSGITVLVLMFIVYLLTDIIHVIPHFHYPLNWHALVLLSGFLLLSAGFLSKYMSINGIEEDIHNFTIMKPNFEKARDWLSENPDDKALREQVIFDLGKKALEENSKWVELHDARRAKPEVE